MSNPLTCAEHLMRNLYAWYLVWRLAVNTADDRDETSVQDPVKSRTPCWTAIEPIIERPLLVERKYCRPSIK